MMCQKEITLRERITAITSEIALIEEIMDLTQEKVKRGTIEVQIRQNKLAKTKLEAELLAKPPEGLNHILNKAVASAKSYEKKAKENSLKYDLTMERIRSLPAKASSLQREKATLFWSRREKALQLRKKYLDLIEEIQEMTTNPPGASETNSRLEEEERDLKNAKADLKAAKNLFTFQESDLIRKRGELSEIEDDLIRFLDQETERQLAKSPKEQDISEASKTPPEQETRGPIDKTSARALIRNAEPAPQQHHCVAIESARTEPSTR